jgi:UPF0176 protein
VFHLRGGILKYLEQIPPSESRWQGDCFVFDQRVSVGHDLLPSTHVMCFGCGWPVSSSQQHHPDYVAGVHCPRCVDQLTDDQKRRFAERQRQIARQHHARVGRSIENGDDSEHPERPPVEDLA